MAAQSPVSDHRPSLSYAWYVVAVLMLAYISSFVDRQIVNLLVKPIKRDLHLSDTEMSLLQGFSFALFYTLLGVPIGRWADRGNRRNIIMLGITVWSMMTAVCGLAKNFWQLFLARVGVGVGEAALTPPAYSLIADYFPKEKLASALSVYSMGIYLGSGLSIFLGALAYELAQIGGTWTVPLVGEIFPWQMAFFLVGIPGLLIVLLLLTVREPVRQQLASHTQTHATLEEVWVYIRANQGAFMGISLGIAFISLTAYAGSAWIPAFLERVHGWSIRQIGVYYGLMVTLVATSGVLAGGAYADRLRKRGYPNARLRVAMIAALGTILSSGWYVFATDGYTAVLCFVLPTFFAAFPIGAAAAAMQELMPPQMRALASAIYFLLLNLIALGFGPTLAAIVTDYVFADEKMVGYSLWIVAVLSGALAVMALRVAMKHYPDSISRLEARN